MPLTSCCRLIARSSLEPVLVGLIGLMASMALAGCAPTPRQGPAGAAVAGDAGDDALVDVVFFRADDGAPRPVNVYVDHAYVASLMPGGFTRARVCRGAVGIGAVFDDASLHHPGRLAGGQPVHHETGQTHYWRVAGSPTAAGRLELVASDRARFDAEVRQAQRQTLSRLERRCVDQRAALQRILDRAGRDD